MLLKLFICLVVLCGAYVQARPGLPEAKILKSDQDVRPDGYDFGFETSNGIRRTETGRFTPTDKELGVLTVDGESTYELDQGIPFHISFVADDKGYRPKYVIGQGQNFNIRKQIAA